VREHFKSIVDNFLLFSAAALVVPAVLYFVDGVAIIAILLGYALSFIFVGSNFFVVRKIHGTAHPTFFKYFLVSIGVRFALVLAGVVTVLIATKIHQIYFTVSFIISYIFHSAIEIISINKLLETDN
jgi:hypothetical protein